MSSKRIRSKLDFWSWALSIKKGTQLSEKEQEELVNNLFSCKEPLVSPFGKPTFKTLTLNEIDNLFNQ